jgi:hypothetical protein
MFLYRYRKNLSLLASHFRELQQEMARPFASMAYYNNEGIESGQDLAEYLMNMVEPELTRVTEALMGSELPRSLPGTLLPMFLEDERARDTILRGCICTTRARDPFLRAFVDNKDVFGEFLTLQGLFRKHINVPGGITSCQARNRCVQEALDRYRAMSAATLRLASEIFEGSGKHEAAAISQKVGLYHPKEVGYHIFRLLDDVADTPDTLGQNALHQWLDASDVLIPASHLEKLQHQPSLMDINKQDLLGRSPLHIACLKNLELVVATLIGRGADVEARTFFGRTALHIAVANDNKTICESLLEHCERSQLEAKDVNGRTARHYAQSIDIIHLLDSHARRFSLTEPSAAGKSGPSTSFVDLPGNSTIGTIDKDEKFKCLAVSCYDMSFARQADFRQHFENEHMPTKLEYFCPREGCPRSRKPTGSRKAKSFGTRQDKMTEHLRTVHGHGRPDSISEHQQDQISSLPSINYSIDFTDNNSPDNRRLQIASAYSNMSNTPASAYSSWSLRSVLAHGAL